MEFITACYFLSLSAEASRLRSPPRCCGAPSWRWRPVRDLFMEIPMIAITIAMSKIMINVVDIVPNSLCDFISLDRSRLNYTMNLCRGGLCGRAKSLTKGFHITADWQNVS
jgi:hypothetical protein